MSHSPVDPGTHQCRECHANLDQDPRERSSLCERCEPCLTCGEPTDGPICQVCTVVQYDDHLAQESGKPCAFHGMIEVGNCLDCAVDYAAAMA